MADKDAIQPVVIDIRSGSIKAGFAGDDVPRTVFPTVVGKPQFGNPVNRVTCVGYEALSQRNILQLQYPIERGFVTNWDAMEEILHHTFYRELRVCPEEHPVLLTKGPLFSNLQMEKMTQIMFETFNVPALYFANQEVLSLYSSGRTTGVVVDCGDRMSYSVPVFEGNVVSYAILWLEVGGWDLTEYLWDMLNSRGYNLSSLGEKRGYVREMKHELCYVPLDYDRELESAEIRGSSTIDKNYELPDGQVITIGAERFKCPEVLFQPYLMDKDADGIHEIANDSVKKCNGYMREDLYANIVLSGGSTLFPGFADRLNKEITSLAPRSSKIKVVALPERRYSAWIGGSSLASMRTFQQMWISKGEYDESGPAIVHQKC